MRKKQNMRTAYSKPSIEVMHVHMDCQLMEASYPGDHEKGNHKQGPPEETSNGAKQSFFFSSDENNTSSTSWN